MRYQRHVDTHHALHAKEVAETLARVVREDRVETVFLAGDEVIVPNPGFPIYESVIKYSGAKAVPIKLAEKDGFAFSAEAILSQITAKTRLIIINSPQLYTLPLGLALFQQHQRSLWNLIMAGSVLGALPLILVFFIFQKQFVRGISLSGVKG